MLRESVQYRVGEEEAVLSLDLAGAYPPEAGILAWIRTVVLRRGVSVEVTDSFRLESAPALIPTLSLLTPSNVSVDSAVGMAVFSAAPIGPDANARRAALPDSILEIGTFDVSVARIAIDDVRLGQAWGDHLSRLTFKFPGFAPGSHVDLAVSGIDTGPRR